jgi:hypothetical protein
MSIVGHNSGRIQVQGVFQKFKSMTLLYMEEAVVKIRVRSMATH